MCFPRKVPAGWLGRTRFGDISVGIAGCIGRHHRGSIAYAIHARGLRGFSQFRLHRYGTLVWHDAHSAVLRVGLRLATPQLVSVIGLTFASMVTGVMVIENLFALPGIGNGLVTDVGNRDLIAVQSELFLLAAFFLTVGLVVDLFHRVLDPRLKTATAITEVTA